MVTVVYVEFCCVKLALTFVEHVPGFTKVQGLIFTRKTKRDETSAFPVGLPVEVIVSILYDSHLNPLAYIYRQHPAAINCLVISGHAIRIPANGEYWSGSSDSGGSMAQPTGIRIFKLLN